MTGGEWLRNSLRYRETEMMSAARRARAAYTKGPMRDACLKLADAYEAAGRVFTQALCDSINEDGAHVEEP